MVLMKARLEKSCLSTKRNLRKFRPRGQMDAIRIIFIKIIMWFLVAGFGCNFILQTISYSFYKNAKKMTDVSCIP